MFFDRIAKTFLCQKGCENVVSEYQGTKTEEEKS